MSNFPIGLYAFNPKQIPGLVAWFDGNDPAGTGVQPANGSSISTLADKSKSGNNLTQGVGANQPIFNKNQFNGLASILYNGSSNSLSGTVLSNTLHTVFISSTCITTTGTRDLFYNGSSGTNGYGYSNNGGRSILFGGVTFKTDGTITTSLERVTFSWDGTTSILRLNGAQQTITSTTSAPNSPPTGNLIIGKDTATAYWSGYINEILIYNTGTLSATNILNVEKYLRRWG